MSNDIKNGKIVAFMNMKGGVAKTTLCISIGEYIANFRNKKVLFIDLDPQFNLTQTFLHYSSKENYYLEGIRNKNGEVEKPLTIYDLYKIDEDIKILEENKNNEMLQAIYKINDNMDIIYGSIDMIRLTAQEPLKYVILNFIENNNLRIKYDFIFLDCPPTISLYTSSALHASDYYVVPTKLDRYSVLGVKLLSDAIKIEEKNSNRKLEIRPLGIIYTMEKSTTQRANRLKVDFEESKYVKEMGIFDKSSSYCNHVFEGQKRNVMSQYETSLKEVEKISDEFLARVERKG